mmetsp:Transcript_30115/g.76054  ORF Transcript_30115/g.76054 Transcript_30115/m.76054 type:complete len:502 (+) Transcript_30115:181-1686(+)
MAQLQSDANGASPMDTFFDAEEPEQRSKRVPLGRQNRMSTDFPEFEASQPMGPWRTTEVESRESDTWLLVGRRHSVDERRDAMEQGKALFLRVLATRADGVWRARTAARADELQALEDDIQTQLSQQAQSLKVSRDFWAERYDSDRAYLGRLESSTLAAKKSALPHSQVRQQAEWRTVIERAAEQAEGWARRLPELVASHEDAAAEVRKAVARAVGESGEASKLVRAAREEVWPAAAPMSTKALLAPGTHAPDQGPEGACLWLTVRRYLAACDRLQSSQIVALARLHRAKRRVAELGQWVNETLGRGLGGDLTVSLPCSPSSPLQHIGGSPAEQEEEEKQEAEEEEEEESSEHSDESSDAEGLDMSMDLSALIVHEQHVELCTSSGEECDSWATARLLLSVDLWLHVWTADMPSESVPMTSIPLARTCLRPVAERSTTDHRVLYFVFRPPTAPGLFTSLSTLLRRGQDSVPQELRLRCGDLASSDELLAALELVEKLYPIV